MVIIGRVKDGYSRRNPGFCVDVWDVMERWMPEAIKEANHIGREKAIHEILARYRKTVVVVQEREIVRLFNWGNGNG